MQNVIGGMARIQASWELISAIANAWCAWPPSTAEGRGSLKCRAVFSSWKSTWKLNSFEKSGSQDMNHWLLKISLHVMKKIIQNDFFSWIISSGANTLREKRKGAVNWNSQLELNSNLWNLSEHSLIESFVPLYYVSFFVFLHGHEQLKSLADLDSIC